MNPKTAKWRKRRNKDQATADSEAAIANIPSDPARRADIKHQLRTETNSKAKGLRGMMAAAAIASFEYEGLDDPRVRKEREVRIKRWFEAAAQLAISTPNQALLDELGSREVRLVVDTELAATGLASLLEVEPNLPPSVPSQQSFDSLFPQSGSGQ